MDITLQMKQSECERLQRDLQNLQIKYNNLNESYQREKEEKNKTIENLSKEIPIVFPPVERIPSDKIFEAYSKIYDAYKKIFNEKEIVINSLKNEILVNDQQRNYIEILKQTIESSLIKSGLKSQIDNSVFDSTDNFASKEFPETLNFVIEFSNLQNENEKLKGEKSSLEMLNTKLKEEVDYLNTSNENFKQKIQSSLESGIKELEDTKAQVKTLENEKEILTKELSESNMYNERLKNVVQKFEEENNKTTEQIKNLQKNFEEKSKEQIEKSLKVKDENSQLNLLVNELMNNVENLKENKKFMENKLDLLQKEKVKIEKDFINLKEINDSFISQKNKKEEDNLNQIQNLKNINEKLATELDNVQKALTIAKDSLSKLEKEKDIMSIELQTKATNENELEKRIMEHKEEIYKLKSNRNMEMTNNENEDLALMVKNLISTIQNYLQSSNFNKGEYNNSHYFSMFESSKNLLEKLEKFYINLNQSKKPMELDKVSKEINSYKKDNKKLYEMNKKLLEENSSNFFYKKENKFFLKLLNRIIKYHLANMDTKNIVSQIIHINDDAICLEIDKSKIEAKIDNLIKNSEKNKNEIEKSKDLIKQIDSQVQDKFVLLKNLDSQLKSLEMSSITE